ncbi:SPRY domain-containing protein 3-like, partial [Ruditapes philippinarum]|uniref:SPRY domain-containing protein 3-like n=1 Tax=Ruditapes philippinarum TaxID=129788 RepID=UPI00295BDD30
MKTCKQLGALHKPNESGVALREESVKANKATPVTKALCSPKAQSLLDRQLLCKNLIIDGDFISYDEKAKGDLGLFIDKNTLKFDRRNSFEIEVMSIGRDGDIAIGMVPDNYKNNLLPGIGIASSGYHSDG